MTKKTWGGRREGSGRPRSVEVKRKQRALYFFDGEWELIRQKAAKSGLSPRAYLYRLVEADALKGA